MSDNVPPGHCRCGGCNKVMLASEWPEHIKESTHQKLTAEFYKMIDEKFGK